MSAVPVFEWSHLAKLYVHEREIACHWAEPGISAVPVLKDVI